MTLQTQPRSTGGMLGGLAQEGALERSEHVVIARRHYRRGAGIRIGTHREQRGEFVGPAGVCEHLVALFGNVEGAVVQQLGEPDHVPF